MDEKNLPTEGQPNGQIDSSKYSPYHITGSTVEHPTHSDFMLKYTTLKKTQENYIQYRFNDEWWLYAVINIL